MIEISFFTGEALLAGCYLFLRVCVWLKNRRIDRKREAALLLMYLYLAVIVRFVFYPALRENGKVLPLLFHPNRIWPPRLNLIPFLHQFDYTSKWKMAANIVGNILLFVPSGILFPLLYKRLDRFLKVTAAGFGLSLCIELMQLPFRVRTTDTDDLIQNTLGCMIGYGAYVAIKKRKMNRKE